MADHEISADSLGMILGLPYQIKYSRNTVRCNACFLPRPSQGRVNRVETGVASTVYHFGLGYLTGERKKQTSSIRLYILPKFQRQKYQL